MPSFQYPAQGVLDKTEQRTARLLSHPGARRSHGSGVIINYRDVYFVLTALHVVIDMKSTKTIDQFFARLGQIDLTIEYWDKSRAPLSGQVFFLPLQDIAVIGPIFPPMSTRDADFQDVRTHETPNQAEPLIVWGAPHGYGPVPLIGRYKRTLYDILSTGSLTQVKNIDTHWEIEVSAQPGNSGGPVFGFDGRLIGVFHSGITDGRGVPLPLGRLVLMYDQWPKLHAEIDQKYFDVQGK